VKVFVTGANPRLQPHFAELLACDLAEAKVDAHTIQPYYAGLVARECGLAVRVETGPEGLAFIAEPVAAAAPEEADLTAH
jgi:histidine phosphotransferase ChpT